MEQAPRRSAVEFFYPHLEVVYGLGSFEGGKLRLNDSPSEAPKRTTPESHAFLAQLCAEYRDITPLLAAKLRWAASIHKLPVQDSAVFNLTKSVWRQLTGRQYLDLIPLSGLDFSQRKAVLSESPVRIDDLLELTA